MKLKINGLINEIVFNNSNINVLEIKNSKFFSNIIGNLNEEIHGIETDEIFLLDEYNKKLNITNEMYMLFDLYNIDYNSKKILTPIYEIIEKNINKNQDYEIENMMLKIRKYLVEEINELPFEFTMKTELEVPEILKLFGLKIDSTNYTTILEKIEILIDIISTLKIATVIIIPNLKQFLCKDELVELYKYSLYNNVNLLLIERRNIEKLEYEKVLSIDEEFDEQIY